MENITENMNTQEVMESKPVKESNVSEPVKKVTKDPKKQAAGRAGAAARKANQDKLLKELQTAKKDLRKHENTVDTVEPVKTSDSITVSHSASRNISTYIVPTVILGAATAAYYLYTKQQKTREYQPERVTASVQGSVSESVSRVAQKTKTDLNNKNPLYME